MLPKATTVSAGGGIFVERILLSVGSGVLGCFVCIVNLIIKNRVYACFHDHIHLILHPDSQSCNQRYKRQINPAHTEDPKLLYTICVQSTKFAIMTNRVTNNKECMTDKYDITGYLNTGKAQYITAKIKSTLYSLNRKWLNNRMRHL